jgi:hypothetical protein
MIEQSLIHLPELVKDIDHPVFIYLMYLPRIPVNAPYKLEVGLTQVTSTADVAPPSAPGYW